jgi:hypothetical protein
MEQKRENDRAEEAGDRPLQTAEPGADQGKQCTRVRGQDHRPQRSDHERVLVQCKHSRHCGERKQPPAAQVDEPEHQRQADERDQDARDERTH